MADGPDAPSLHTMYADRPMRGRGIMPAIAEIGQAHSSFQKYRFLNAPLTARLVHFRKTAQILEGVGFIAPHLISPRPRWGLLTAIP